MGRLQIRLREMSWASLAGALQSLGPFGSFLILARLATADELGRYSLAVAITVPVFLVARMQLRQAAVADPHGGASFGDYRVLRLIAVTIALAATWVLALLFDPEVSAVICSFALVRWAEDVGDIHYAPLQRASRWRRITASQLLRLVGGLTLLAVGWRLVGLPTALAYVALWQGAVTLLVDSPVAHSLEPGGLAWTRVRRLWRLNWPLGGTAALISLMSYTPRYALSWAGGETLVGDYAALGQIALLGNLVVQGAGQASLARLGAGFVRDRAQFVQVVRELLPAQPVNATLDVRVRKGFASLALLNCSRLVSSPLLSSAGTRRPLRPPSLLAA